MVGKYDVSYSCSEVCNSNHENHDERLCITSIRDRNCFCEDINGSDFKVEVCEKDKVTLILGAIIGISVGVLVVMIVVGIILIIKFAYPNTYQLIKLTFVRKYSSDTNGTPVNSGNSKTGRSTSIPLFTETIVCTGFEITYLECGGLNTNDWMVGSNTILYSELNKDSDDGANILNIA